VAASAPVAARRPPGPAAREAAGRAVTVSAAAVPLAAVEKLLVGSLVEHPPRSENNDAVSQAQRGATVGEEEGGTPPPDRAQRRVDPLLDPGVDGAGGIVEDEDGRVDEERPGERDPLALATRERQAPLPDRRGVAVGQAHDELVRLGATRRLLDVGLGRVGAAVGDVGGNGGREEEALVEHQTDLGPEGRHRGVAHVVAVHPHGPAGHIVEAGHQHRHRRPARAGSADHGDGLAGRDAQVEVRQHRLAAGVGEGDVVEEDLAGERRQGRRIGPLGDERLGGEETEDPLGAGASLLGHEEQAGQHAGRRAEEQQVGREGEEGPEGDLVVQGQVTAEGEHGHLGELRDGGEERLIARLQAYGAKVGAVEALGPLDQVVELALLLAEPLHHPDSGDGFLDDHRHLPLPLLGVPVGRERLLAQHVGRRHERGHGEQRDHGEKGREDEHHDDRRGEEQHVAAHDGQEGEEALQQAEIGVGPRDELTGLHLVVAGEVEADQVVVDGVAQVVLDIEADPAPPVAAHVGTGQRADGEHDQHAEPGREGRVVRQDHVVDDLALDDRGRDRYGAAEEGRSERQEHVATAGADPWGQPPDPALLSGPGVRLRRRCHDCRCTRPVEGGQRLAGETIPGGRRGRCRAPGPCSGARGRPTGDVP
jgi:hypothetical protein